MPSVASDLLTVRVDESGDAGTGGRGTRWLVLAAIAETGEPGELNAAVEEIRHRLSPSGAAALHFSRIRRAGDRYGAYLALARAPFSAVVVAADSHATYPDSGLTEPAVYYRHALRFVLERASRLAAAQERMLDFVIEEAGHFSLPEFHDYVRRIRAAASPRDRMEWDAVDIDLIRTARKDEDPLLGVADGVAHAFFRALEPMPAWDPRCRSTAICSSRVFGAVQLETASWGMASRCCPQRCETRAFSKCPTCGSGRSTRDRLPPSCGIRARERNHSEGGSKLIRSCHVPNAMSTSGSSCPLAR